jgi:exonuclease SbcC
MRPIRLRLESFQSYRGSHEIDFSGLSLAVLTGPNGSGKSSLIDAIRYALWGVTRAGADSVVSEGENVGRVEFEFAMGDDHYLVSRQRNRKGGGGTTLAFGVLDPEGVGMAMLDGKSVAETQAKIESVLRMTDDLFTQTACANQGNAAAFSQARPADRKRVLGDILDLEAFERRAEAARQQSRDAQGRIERGTADLETAQSEAARAPEIEAEIAATAERAAAAGRERDGVQGDLAEAQRQRAAVVAERESAQAKAAELADATARLTAAQAAVVAREAKLRDLQQATMGRENVERALAEAQAAETRAADLLGARDQDQTLAHEEQVLRERLAAATREHAAETSRLQEAITAATREHEHRVAVAEREVAHLRETHAHQVAGLTDHRERLLHQVGLLDQVPCATEDPEMAGRCKLLAAALDARAQIPALDKTIESLMADAPWAEGEAHLEALRAQQAQIAAQESARLAELQRTAPGVGIDAEIAAVGQRRAALGYVAGAWEEAKRQADKRSVIEARMREIAAAAAQAGEVATALAAAQADAADLADRVKGLAAQVTAPEAFEARLRGLDEEIRRCEQAITAAEQQIAAAQGQAGALQERLRAARTAGERAVELQRSLAEMGKRRQLLDLLGNPRSGAFSRSGIPALLIDQAVPELEAEANEVLGELSDGRMSVALRTQRETQAKTLSETLEIIVADERGERSYETFSGGEAMRVDLGLRIGLSQLLARRAGARCELLVMDETAAPLDADGRRLFVGCLGRVAQRFATVLCISHVEEIKDLFPARLEVSRGAEGSRVEVMR